MSARAGPTTRVESALVTRWQEDDPLLRFVTLADIELADVRPLGSDVRALVSTARGVAIGVLPRVDGDITIVSADTDRGPWARTPGFVIFFRNLLEQARTLSMAMSRPGSRSMGSTSTVTPRAAAAAAAASASPCVAFPSLSSTRRPT